MKFTKNIWIMASITPNLNYQKVKKKTYQIKPEDYTALFHNTFGTFIFYFVLSLVFLYLLILCLNLVDYYRKNNSVQKKVNFFYSYPIFYKISKKKSQKPDFLDFFLNILKNIWVKVFFRFSIHVDENVRCKINAKKPKTDLVSFRISDFRF